VDLLQFSSFLLAQDESLEIKLWELFVFCGKENYGNDSESDEHWVEEIRTVSPLRLKSLAVRIIYKNMAIMQWNICVEKGNYY
jgi:hypothetical protein